MNLSIETEQKIFIQATRERLPVNQFREDLLRVSRDEQELEVFLNKRVVMYAQSQLEEEAK